ncbi:sigma-70 family RNA polymerase sigma factor [Clostridium sp. AM49-4BH]|nr:sigma-70 family RNA polymerase sigma factor [Clostridium sp. AM49-4BH]
MVHLWHREVMHWKCAQKGRNKLRRSLTSRQFEQFVATERGMLVRLAMNILHHPEDADDAVAEALCKAWERREQLDHRIKCGRG